MKNKIITSTYFEVCTSESGEPGKWHRHGEPKYQYDDTPVGLKEANAAAAKAGRLNRFVRVAHITRKIKPLKVLENKSILSRQQITALLAVGHAALQDVQGVSVNEGFLIGFGDGGMAHSPTRVTVSFSPTTVLGKCPVNNNRLTGEELTTRFRERQEWNAKAQELTRQTLALCETKLAALNINHIRHSQEILLKP